MESDAGTKKSARFYTNALRSLYLAAFATLYYYYTTPFGSRSTLEVEGAGHTHQALHSLFILLLPISLYIDALVLNLVKEHLDGLVYLPFDRFDHRCNRTLG